MAQSRGIRFFPFAGRRVAYRLSGSGPLLVAPAWWISHLELDWQNPRFRRFWEGTTEGFRLVRYDRPGVGLSDRDVPPEESTLEREVELLNAMLDVLDCERATLFGGSSGGPTAITFAARFPHRVERLLLYGTFADGASIAPGEVREAILTAVRSHWGLGSRLLADVFLGDEGSAEREQFAQAQRDSSDAETAAVMLEQIYATDVRAQLGRVSAPTLIVHRRADRAIPYELGRRVAAGIEQAAFVPLEGSAHIPWLGDEVAVTRALRSGLLPLGEGQPTDAGESPAVVLSPREREVLSLVAEGMTEREIAERLVVSPHTVHRHMANIRAKLGRGSGASAVADATRLGLI
jgi:pimeloyl-ACP methyl ester carboxylesterase/DNA-binding CsgD family transcriptional regulator